MTEQEAEAFAARLTRVWGVLAPFRVRPSGGFHFVAPLSPDVELRVIIIPFDARLLAQYALHEIGPNLAFLRCIDSFELLESPLGDYVTTAPKDIRQRQNEWLPLFSRNCWLSGCAVEASAHEKMEWMRGFSREELEAWNLKM